MIVSLCCFFVILDQDVLRGCLKTVCVLLKKLIRVWNDVTSVNDGMFVLVLLLRNLNVIAQT